MANKDDEIKTLGQHAVDTIYDVLNKKGFIDFNDGMTRVNLLMLFQHLFIEFHGEEKFKELDKKIAKKLNETTKTLN